MLMTPCNMCTVEFNWKNPDINGQNINHVLKIWSMFVFIFSHS